MRPVRHLPCRQRIAAGLLGGWLAALMSFSGCSPAPGEALNTPAPPASIYDRLKTAYQLPDRAERRQAVLSLLHPFLDGLDARKLSDQAASSFLTEIAFSSKTLSFSDPAFVRSHDRTYVVGLPDALGLMVVDLSDPPSAEPLEISRWTVGLDAVEVTWRGAEAGVSYVTLGSDGLRRVHYALIQRGNAGWQVAWLGDEVPEWWFNAVDASLSVAPDLSWLTVEGSSRSTTPVFLETDGRPRRRFRVTWQRQGQGYAQSPAMGGKDDRQRWFWRVAVPSAYATLVEFLERLRGRDMQGAGMLVTDPEIVAAAMSYGLYLPDAVFTVTAADDRSIHFSGQRGAFVATFQPPQQGLKWLITGLRPEGAASPTPTMAHP